MKERKCIPLLRRLTSLVTAAALLLLPSTAQAAAGEKKLRTSISLADGLTYVNTVTEHPAAGRVESFALELSPDSDARPMLVQGSGSIYGAGSINAAVEQAQAMGCHVLAAVNTDFFSTATGVPIGLVIADGVYQSSAEGRSALVFSDGQALLKEDPQIELTLVNQRTGRQLAPQHLNKRRTASGGLYLLNEDFSAETHTSGSGWMVRLAPEDREDRSWWPPSTWFSREEQTEREPLTLSSQLTLQVTELLQTDQSVSIGPGEYILTADDKDSLADVYQSFQVGDTVTLTTWCGDPELADAQWATGVGDVMIRDGALTDSASWTYVKTGRDPRTAVGMRRDGTLVLYAVDGRKAGVSGGLSQVDLAQELLEQDCVWAANLDGGGSTAMSVWVPGQTGPAVVNRPSDGKPRNCATYLLLVSDDAGDGRPSRLALKQDGLVVLAGSSVDLGEALCMDSGLNPVNASDQDVIMRSQSGLGSVDGTVYTAGLWPGTDTIDLYSPSTGAAGSAQVHVVDRLTELTIQRTDTGKDAASLTVKPGQQIPLSAFGSYWSLPALREVSSIVWTVEGDIGAVDAAGVFTASQTAGAVGSISAAAGGLTRTIPVSLVNAHKDVPEGHWAYEAVEYCYANQLVNGVSSSLFGADANIRRADFLLTLYRLAGSPAVSSLESFPDVAATDYYAAAVAWAKQNGLASGVDGGLFAPNSPITREQAFTIIGRALPALGIQYAVAPLSVLDSFSDSGELASWSSQHIANLVACQLVGGSGGRLDPRGSLSRAQMAVLLYKLGTFDASAVPPVVPVVPDGQQRSGVVTVESGNLNVRSGPGYDYGVIDALGAGTVVAVLSRTEGGWLYVQYAGAAGTTAGYVSADYVTMIE